MGEARDERATELDMLSKGLKIVTRCKTEDELAAAFWRFCTATTCFIPTKDRRRVGIESLFSLRLADNTVAVRGLCLVRDVWDAGDNPFGRPGIQVEVLRISDDTKELYARIVALRAANTAIVAEVSAPTATARIEARADMDTVAMPPAIPPELLSSDAADEPAAECSIADDGEPSSRAPTEVDPPSPAAGAEPEPFPPIADTAVDHAAPRGTIPTLLGVPPVDTAAPRYVADEPPARKLVSPIRPSWWARLVAALRTMLHGRRARAPQ